jgi:hypothetical protein
MLLLLSITYTLISKLNLLFYKNFSIFFSIPISKPGRGGSIPNNGTFSNSSNLSEQNTSNQDLLKLASSIYRITKALKLVDSQITFDSSKCNNLLLKLGSGNVLSQYTQIGLYLSLAPKYSIRGSVSNELFYSLEKNYFLSSNIKSFNETYSQEVSLKSILSVPINIQKVFTNNLTQDYLLASQSR